MKHTNPAVFPILSFVSVHFSRSVVSDSLWPHGMRHARPPCPSPTPGACSNSCPSSRWCHPTILSSVVPFSSCLQSFPASGSQMSQFFASGGQSIGASVSASVLPINIQGWFPLGLTGLISFFFCLYMSFLTCTVLECLSTHSRFVWKTYSGNENHYLMEMLAYNTSLQN